MTDFKDSVILIDKTAGPTSFDTLMDVKRIIRQKKTGHCGTLDSFATGLLVMCTGICTRLVQYLMADTKQYRTVIQLGTGTDTDDCTGNVTEQSSFTGITADDIRLCLASFTGALKQKPPVYSALKIHGRRASDLVRKGEEVELAPRDVFIYSADLLDWNEKTGCLAADVVCSKGTYIRSLARDLGRELGTCAHCCELRRTASGHFSAEQAVTVQELRDIMAGAPCSRRFVLTAEEATADFDRLILNPSGVKKALNGAFFRQEEVISRKGSLKREFIILDEYENLIAIAKMNMDTWQIKYLNVFNSRNPQTV